MNACMDEIADRRHFLQLAGAALALASLGGAGEVMATGASFAAIPKSLWVWRTPLSESSDVMDIVRKYNFHTVFYSIPPAERQALFAGEKRETEVIHAFREAGVTFYAVAGDPAWTRRPQQIPHAVEDLLSFQARTRLLDGLCLDIEPQALPEWKNGGPAQEEELGETRQPPSPAERMDPRGAHSFRVVTGRERAHLAGASGGREEIIRNYLELLGGISRAGTSENVKLAAAVAPFYANQPSPSGGSMLEAAAGQVQETIMMAYRNTPEAALRVSRKALQQLEGENRPWWFGVSTFHRAKSPDVSYAGSTFEQFSAAMLNLDQSLSNSSRGLYRGIAINDYPSLTAILRT